MEMTGPSQLEMASALPEWSRPPLSSVTNPPPPTSTLSQCPNIRRKSSLIRRFDSSEAILSSHESIFQAEHFSSTNSDEGGFESGTKDTLSTMSTLIASVNLMSNDENVRDMFPAPRIGNTHVHYGYGTALATIVEQKSSMTMSRKDSSFHPRSTSEISLAKISYQNLLGHRNSFDLPTTVTLRPPRRRKSFSVDDLVLIKRSYHEACAMIEGTNINSSYIHRVYAEPRVPVLPPIERRPTPPGVPSWTAAQNAPVQTSVRPNDGFAEGAQSRLQRFLGIQRNSSGFSSHAPFPALMQHSSRNAHAVGGGRSASNPLPARAAPRFRPIRGGHGTGPLESHPFHHARLAEAKSDTISTVPQAQASNLPLSSQFHAPQRAQKIVVRGKMRGKRNSRIAGGLQAPRPFALESHLVEHGHDEVSRQCQHHQARSTSLRRLNQYSDVVHSDPIRSTAARTLLGLNETQGVPSQPTGSTSIPAVAQPQTTVASAVDPVMTGATVSVPITATLPIASTPKAHRCWKCHVSALASSLDDIWETGTCWCCWWLCGVDLADDVEPEDHTHGNGTRSGYSRGSLGPRRVLLDGMPVASC